MSNDIQKADQIAYRFYTKLSLVLSNSRATAEPGAQAKLDKWFNLETPDPDLFKDQLRIYRNVSTSSPPPLEFQVLLTIPELTNNQVLVHRSPDSSRMRIDPTPQHILLESWVVSFTPYAPQHHYAEERADVAPSTIYKHGVSLFRSVYTLLRVLPCWKLYKRLRRRTAGGNRNGNLSIQLRVQGPVEEPDGFNVLGFGTRPVPNSLPLPTEAHAFPPIPHSMGTISLSTKYLSSPNFQLDDLESLLSSRFLSLDEGPEFTPTLSKNQQRESISSPPGSLPIRTSLPKSPPASIADRFVLPPPVSSRTASLPSGSPGSRNILLPLSRQTSAQVAGTAGSGSGISVASSRQDSSSAWSKDEGRPLSGLAARLRKESIGAGRGADLPSSPGPLPIRRPNINPVHPFKSSTLSSGSPSLHSPSPSLRQPSPLSSGGIPSLPSRPTQVSPGSSRVPPSPIGMGNRPSPPFAPSSLGDRRSLASVEGDEASATRMPPRKRYSSSFGHRYAPGAGAGSEGSAGSGERKEGERPGNASFLSTNTDDDDISVFVQDIDARKPLSGHHRHHSMPTGPAPIPGCSHDREASATRSGAGNGGSGSSRGHNDEGAGVCVATESRSVLTSELEIDAKLREMKEAFEASMQVFSGTLRRERQRVRDRPSREASDGGRSSSQRRRRTTSDAYALRDEEFETQARREVLIDLPLPRSDSPAGSDGGMGQGSDEVMGRLSLGERGEWSRSRP